MHLLVTCLILNLIPQPGLSQTISPKESLPIIDQVSLNWTRVNNNNVEDDFLQNNTNTNDDFLHTTDSFEGNSNVNDAQIEVNKCHFEYTCVRKCCNKGSIFTFSHGCVTAEPLNISEWMQPSGAEKNYTLLFGQIPNGKATNETVCPILAKNEYEFLKNSGEVFYKERKQKYSSDDFCMDSQYHEHGGVTEFAVICMEPIKIDSIDNVANVFQKIGLIISSLSLAIIVVLYVACPAREELQLQNKCILSSCVNLLFALVLLIINMTEAITTKLQYSICVTLGISIQFFFLSFYFWLNVMIYDISRVIRGTVKMKLLSTLEQKKRRFYYYAIYALGCPLVISNVTVIMQLLPKEEDTLIIRPNIGEGRCWFKDGVEIYAYYYGIEISLHILNFFLILYCFYLLKGETLVDCLLRKRNESNQFEMRNHTRKNHLRVFWQQFFTYILYIFLWILNIVTLIYPRKRFWRLIDIAVSFQGFFLLIIVFMSGNKMVKNLFEKTSKMAKSWSLSTSSLSLKTRSTVLNYPKT